jgi:uncharacterized hydrophobic protein (TIGR00271 family)
VWYSLKRWLVRGRREFKKISKGNSGEWAWLNSKPLPLPVLNRKLWQTAEPSASYFVLLSLSAVISTLGLLANSSATIIGAMIIAPLMGPLLGIAFSMVMANRRLLRRSALGLTLGVLLTIVMSGLIAFFAGLTTLTPEIQARMSPTLLDLGVALAAGAAGAYAKSRREIADALPGVAIAVALVPPLSVIGIGLALQSREVAFGSTLLFLTNLIGIIFSGGLVFLMQRYGSLDRAQRGLTLAVGILAILGIPLGLSFQDLVIREQTRGEINRLIREQSFTFSDTDIRRLTVNRNNGILIVDLEVAATEDSISENQINLVREFLQISLNRPVSLSVTIVPVQAFFAPAQSVGVP